MNRKFQKNINVSFFLAKKPFLEVLDHLDTDRIAVNPFTQNLILEEELIKVVLSCRK